MRTGNLHGLLDAMHDLAKTEDALNRIDANESDLAVSLINLARETGLSEDQIIDALGSPPANPRPDIHGGHGLGHHKCYDDCPDPCPLEGSRVIAP